MAKRALALALGLILGLLLLEGAMRLIAGLTPDAQPPEMRPIPGGAPIVTRWPETADDGFKILVVGDSFTLGRGVKLEEVYPARLEATLRADRHPVQVTSYSFPGWNSRAEAEAVARDLDRYAPDLLIVGHCLNDAEKLPTARATVNRPELRPWQPSGRFETFLAAHSLAFGRARRAIDTLRLRPMLRDYYRELYRDERGREIWRRSLARLQQLASQRSIPTVLVVFPIFDSDPGKNYPYRDLHRIVAETGSALGFEVLDLQPAYAGIDGRALALVPFTDPHPSALGHDIAGREIAKFLIERGLVVSKRPPPDDRRPTLPVAR